MKYDTIYHLEGAPISTAARGGEAGRFLEGTPWQFGDATGRYKVSTATVHGRPNTKAIECVTAAGSLYVPSTQAYGEWEFDIFNANLAAECFVSFIANIPGHYSVQQGYMLYQWGDGSIGVLRTNGLGASINLIVSAAGFFVANTWYHVTITHSSVTGKFALYVRGGVHKTTELVGESVADHTWPTSKVMSIYSSADDKFANLTLKPLA